MEKELKHLLSSTKSILKRQKELSKLKGENFNVFSILKMESKENETHSAFLGELLNPKGSHLMGDIFLELFYNTLPKLENHTFDVKNAKIKLEQNIGVKDLKNKTGGRIDIYLWDTEGNTISIENKIYASDQEAQIERYINHNKVKNAVYYLTLNKQEAGDYTSGNYQEGNDYLEISYSYHIVKWLELCLEKSVEQPILRETIKQYIHLLKRLTGNLTNNKMQSEVNKLIKENYIAAKTIQSSLGQLELDHAVIFMNELKEEITNGLSPKEGFKVTIDEQLTIAYSGLHVKHEDWNGIEMKLEGGSKIPWSTNIFGIKASKTSFNRSKIEEEFRDLEEFQEGYKSNQYWPFYKDIVTFTSDEDRSRLFDDKQRKDLVKSVGDIIINLVNLCDNKLQNKEFVLA